MNFKLSVPNGLPTKLCSMCVKNLNSCYHVYISAIKAQNNLITLMEDKKRIHFDFMQVISKLIS